MGWIQDKEKKDLKKLHKKIKTSKGKMSSKKILKEYKKAKNY